MKKIVIITGTRADYGLLRPLIRSIHDDESFELKLIVSAMHLSYDFGNTIDEIIHDGFKIDKKVDCLLSTDNSVGITKSIGVALIAFADVLEDLAPDFAIILGDRTEMIAFAIACNIANVPIGHIHGGETTEGAYDESLRHSITKMSYLHFASTEKYAKRIIQLGESPDRVFNVGAIGIDSIKNIQLLCKSDFESSIDFELGGKVALVTFHPVTLEENNKLKQINELLNALSAFENLKIIFTYANSDKNGQVINKRIDQFVKDNSTRSIAFKSLGQQRYLSALRHVDLVIGNSSSGILEAPYFYVPTVNIGDRQKGRICSSSVIDVKTECESLIKAIKKGLDPLFRDNIRNQQLYYGNGETAQTIVDILKRDIPVKLKKKFHDIL